MDVSFINRKLYVTFDYDQSLVEAMRSIPGARFDYETKQWIVPCTFDAINIIKDSGGQVPKRAIEYIRKSKGEISLVTRRIERIREIGYTNELIEKIKPYEYDFGKFKPYPHQYAAFVMAADAPFAALFFDPGLGKTYAFIHIMKYRLENGLNERFIIVAPDKVKRVWVEEIDKFAPELNKDVLIIKSGARSARIKRLALWKDYKIIIMNYEMLAPYKTEIAKIRYDGMILDESTKIKNPKAKMTKAALALGRRASFRGIATGTPITESVLEIYTQFEFLNSKIMDYGSYYAFENDCAVKKEIQTKTGKRVKIVVGIRKKCTERIKDIIKSVSLSCTDEDVGEDIIKDNIRIVRHVELNPEERKLYNDVVEGFIYDWNNGKIVSVNEAVSRIIKLRQITSGFLYVDDDTIRVSNPSKISMLDELLDEYIGRKIIIWTNFKEEQTMLKELFTKRGLHQKDFRFIHGGLNYSRAEEAVKEFVNGKVSLLIPQIETLKFGITIPADASIFMSNPFSYESKRQAMRRSERLKIGRRVRFIDIVALDSIDESIYNALNNKKQLVDEIKRMMKNNSFDPNAIV